MTRFRQTAIAALLAASLGATAAPARSDARVPVLVELFTSEGCSSCPPADSVLERFDRMQPVAGADIIVLSEHVDYWNSLGWTDPFSSEQFTARQYQYANKINPKDGAYTPQMVIDGRAELVGSDSEAARAAIERAVTAKKYPLEIADASREGDRITLRVQAAPTLDGSAVLYVALAESHASTHVLRGENAGRTLSHVAAVRSLTLIGKLSPASAASRDVTLPLPAGAGANGLRVVAFIQDANTGAVLSVTSRTL